MSEIESEAKFMWKLVKDILLLPITLIMVIAKKKEAKELFSPIVTVWNFLWEAKVTAWLVAANIVWFFLVIILVNVGVFSENFIEMYLINVPGDIFAFNLIPLLGSMFFHGGLGHLFGNMLALLVLGRVVEREFGSIKMFLIYMFAGLISSVGDSIIRYSIGDTMGAVGASGAIAGLASAAMLIAPLSFTFILMGLPIPIFVVGWIFLASDISGLIAPVAGDNVGHIAHLAGFIAITLTIVFFSKDDRAKLKKGLLINFIALVVMGLLWWFVIRN